MPRAPLPALLATLALAACASPGGPAGADPAARMPARVLDQERVPLGGPGLDLVARYRAPTGSYSTVFLTADPSAAGGPDGVSSPALARNHALSVRAMITAAAPRGPAGTPSDATVRLRDGRLEMRCGFLPLPGSLEAVCLSLVGGQVAKVRATVAGLRGKPRELITYATAVSAALLLALREGAPAAPEEPDAYGVEEEPATGPGLFRT